MKTGVFFCGRQKLETLNNNKYIFETFFLVSSILTYVSPREKKNMKLVLEASVSRKATSISGSIFNFSFLAIHHAVGHRPGAVLMCPSCRGMELSRGHPQGAWRHGLVPCWVLVARGS